MKNFLLVLALFLAFDGFSQEQPDSTQPTGMYPFTKAQNVRGLRWNGGKFEAELYMPRKDTSWTPSEIGAITFWEHDGVDTAIWYCVRLSGGRKWYKLSNLTTVASVAYADSSGKYAEQDPVGIAKTITVTGSNGIIVPEETSTQTIGSNPVYDVSLDTNFLNNRYLSSIPNLQQVVTVGNTSNKNIVLQKTDTIGVDETPRLQFKRSYYDTLDEDQIEVWSIYNDSSKLNIAGSDLNAAIRFYNDLQFHYIPKYTDSNYAFLVVDTTNGTVRAMNADSLLKTSLSAIEPILYDSLAGEISHDKVAQNVGWRFNVNIDSFGHTIQTRAVTTDSLPEGTANLYFTIPRVRSALEGVAPIDFDNTSGQILHNQSGVTPGRYNRFGVDAYGHIYDAVNTNTDSLTEGSTNLYYTNERSQDATATLIQNGTGISWNYNDGANTLTPTVTLAPFSTTNLSEGSNLYYTDLRARAALSLTTNGSGAATYNDATGVFNIPTPSTNYEAPLTFSTGLTRTSNTVTANISTGMAGGQTAIGGTASENNLTLSSTSHSTKGKIVFGSASVYDEANNRWGAGTTTPNTNLEVSGNNTSNLRISNTNDPTAYFIDFQANYDASNPFNINVASQNILRYNSNLNSVLLQRESGNVVIGSSSTFSEKFVVNGAGKFLVDGSAVSLYLSGAIRNTASQYFDYGTSGAGDLYFRGGSGLSNALTLRNDSKIEIPTTPTTSTTGFHILTRNDATGIVEKISSLPGDSAFWKNDATFTGNRVHNVNNHTWNVDSASFIAFNTARSQNFQQAQAYLDLSTVNTEWKFDIPAVSHTNGGTSIYQDGYYMDLLAKGHGNFTNYSKIRIDPDSTYLSGSGSHQIVLQTANTSLRLENQQLQIRRTSTDVPYIVLKNDEGEVENPEGGAMIAGSARGGAIVFDNNSTSAGDHAVKIGSINNDGSFTEAMRFSDGNAYVQFFKNIKTVAPTGGTAAEWKLGTYITGSSVSVSSSKYVEVEVNGVLVKLAVVEGL